MVTDSGITVDSTGTSTQQWQTKKRLIKIINSHYESHLFRKTKTSDFFEANIRTFDAKHPYFCPKKSDVLLLPKNRFCYAISIREIYIGSNGGKAKEDMGFPVYQVLLQRKKICRNRQFTRARKVQRRQYWDLYLRNWDNKSKLNGPEWNEKAWFSAKNAEVFLWVIKNHLTFASLLRTEGA